ncbi:MAG: T9SS C-terminal target domain-containing protein [Ignavibacteriales bacterium]|nr:MAG: T9SS C-terminal target domain-containing protein [Ignavibacteriales bacterium]
MKIILTVIFLSSIIAAQNTYSIQPGVNNNQIVLELSNTSLSETANNLEVKLIRNSQNLTFNQTEKLIENITQGEEIEAAFTFDVDYNIGNAEADTLEFMITDGNAIYLTKQFILQYSIPTEYKLEQNYPNPFNPSTSIRYQVSSISQVSIKVYDILGNEVTTLVNEQKEPGYYEIDFNAGSFASGVYIYRLQANNYVSTKKMMLLK